MNHIDIMLDRNLDNLIARQVRGNGCILAPLANHVRLVGLLPVHAQPVLVAEHCDGL